MVLWNQAWGRGYGWQPPSRLTRLLGHWLWSQSAWVHLMTLLSVMLGPLNSLCLVFLTVKWDNNPHTYLIRLAYRLNELIEVKFSK